VKLFLGIDGGGTKTAACILDETGTQIGRGAGGPCNIISFPDETLRDSIRDATADAIRSAELPADTQFTGVCAGVAGYTSKSRQAAFQNILDESISAETHYVEPDFTIAWWGATGGEPGVVCIAGTGAVVYGQNADGKSRRVDGRGFLLGDSGSGFDLGLRALTHTMRFLETGLRLDPLDEAILNSTGAENADDLVEWTQVGFDPARIASLAPIIGQAAKDGNNLAIKLIRDCGTRLRKSVDQAFIWLRLPADTPVYRLGGLWQLGDILTDAFSQGNLNLQEPLHDSAYGAALLATRSAK
jgi:N-acetylglucosamine kinase